MLQVQAGDEMDVTGRLFKLVAERVAGSDVM